ncbi:uncharacterized protein LOC127078963 [Lathyrus oleraceus]|uniref:uncharacterized protein LOC127078963 n=1 Tax=Pisum sativum TaxID=3888 RepID=UPI0021D2DB9E|nr:uncharacterized protein LOC127078963 [Pisum sativum]
MGRLEESFKSFMLRTEMAKHMGHIPAENLSSDWSVIPITNAMKEHCGMEFQSDAKPEKVEAVEKKETSVLNKDVILVAEKPEKKIKPQTVWVLESLASHLHPIQTKEKHENQISGSLTLPLKPPDTDSFVKHLPKRKPPPKPPDLSEFVSKERGEMTSMEKRGEVIAKQHLDEECLDVCWDSVSHIELDIMSDGKKKKKKRKQRSYRFLPASDTIKKETHNMKMYFLDLVNNT